MSVKEILKHMLFTAFVISVIGFMGLVHLRGLEIEKIKHTHTDTYEVVSSHISNSQSIYGTSHTYYLIVKDKNGVMKTYSVSAEEYFTAKETGFYVKETYGD